MRADEKTRQERLNDFIEFSRHQQRTGDVDPVYYVLEELYRGLPENEAFWRTMLYVAYYNLPSAFLSWRSIHTMTPGGSITEPSESLLHLPTGVERRGLRSSERMLEHLNQLVALNARYHGNWRTALEVGFVEPVGDVQAEAICEGNWTVLNQTLMTIKHNGRWAAYKTAEILQKVHNLQVVPVDMGNAFSTGPRHGLALFYGPVDGNTKAAIAALDRQGERLQDILANAGVYLDIAQVETMLCDYHSLFKGNYYIGHDIEQMNDQIKAARDKYRAVDFGPIDRAMADTLPAEYLQSGVDRARKLIYRDTGKLVWR